MNSGITGLNIPSPIARVVHPVLQEASVHLSVKREDLIDPEISGNKWRKLHHNISHAVHNHHRTLVTFGGAFSNHIYATAAAAKRVGLSSVGIIRGESDDHNPTLIYARSCGMQLHFVDRSSYRQKEDSPVVRSILQTIDHPYLIPEGGSNELAKQGLSELAEEINTTDAQVVMVSAGTGMTAAGILDFLDEDKELWVFSSLKSDHLRREILSLCKNDDSAQLRMLTDYHFGGYGKVPPELVQTINDFQAYSGIPVDPIYNGKLIAGFLDMVERQQVDISKKYLWIHTGGLQGISAYNYMAAKKQKIQIADS